jgi:hypothetical protein
LWHFLADNGHVARHLPSLVEGCDQKRSLLLALRLKDEVLAVVPHRQWVFTIPKRLRVYFRYDRKLLGKLCRAAYDTVYNVFKLWMNSISICRYSIFTLWSRIPGKSPILKVNSYQIFYSDPERTSSLWPQA